jgi:F-box-like
MSSVCVHSLRFANYNDHMTSVMNTLNTIISLNGIAANVQVAKRLIEQDDRRLSELQSSKDGLIRSRTTKELHVRSMAKARRDELLRKIAEADDWEKGQLERLSTAFDTAQAPLDERIKLLKAHIDASNAAIAPIRILPAELLSNVFCEFVGLDRSPWVLTLVSKSWKQTALTTPWLWRHLFVGSPTGLFSSWSRECSTTGNRLICRSVEDLKMWTDKSGKVPLDVELSRPRAGQDDELLKYLLGEQLSSRIQSLSISLSIPDLEVKGLSVGRFSLLSKFSIKSQYRNAAGPLITSILTRSPRIDEFTSHSPLSDFLPGHRFWNSIRILSLDEYSQSNQLNHIIGALVVVETITGLPDDWPDYTTPTTTLKHVKHISVRCQPESLALLQLPQLETLNLRDPDSWSRSYFGTTPVSGQLDRCWQILMPKLVKLTIVSMDATWLPRLFAPALQTMSWKGVGSYPAAQTAFPLIRFPNVEAFSFDAECSDEILLSAIDCVPNVQDLSLSPGVYKGCSNKWALGLLERLTNRDESPRLRRLTLGTSSHRVGTNKNLAKPLIKRLIESRKLGQTPIEHLEVAWTRRTTGLETIQYVN